MPTACSHGDNRFQNGSHIPDPLPFLLEPRHTGGNYLMERSNEKETAMIDQRISGRRSVSDTTDNFANGEQQAPDSMDLETHQPDPMLQMSSGKLGAGAVSLFGLAILVIVAVVFYGPAVSHTASNAPTATSSSTPHG
jgi:hypothetical protein